VTTDAVESDDDGRVRTLTLNHPNRLNAFTPSSYRLLASELVAAASDDAVAVVLLKGAGRAFCSGVDLTELAAATDGGTDFSAAFAALLDALVTFPKPLVAAVHGAAVGIGFTLLLHCDVVLVAEDARLRAPFTRLGTAPEAGSSWLLPMVIGPQRAAELLLTSRWLEADEAVDWGLAARSCPPDALFDNAIELAHGIAGNAPAATRATKTLLRHGREDAVRAALSRERDAASELREVLGLIGRGDGGHAD
jgi:enoyl-CoA hydratase/carnithine racemase